MRALAAVYLREMRRIFHTPYMVAIYFIVPTLLFGLFTSIYLKQFVHHVPVAIFDEDHSELSRKITLFLQSSPTIHIESYAHSVDDLSKLMRSNTVHGAVHFPKDMQKDLQKGRQVTVDMYRDGAGILYAGLLQKALSQVLLTTNAGVVLARSEKSGNGTAFSKVFANPIRLNKSILYNSSYNYQNYLVPGLTTVTIQMILIMIAVLLINTEIQEGSFKNLVTTANGSPMAILLGKLLAHYTISLYLLLFVFMALFPLIELPSRATFLPLFLLYSLFSLASLSMGMALSSFEHDQLVAGDLALFYTAPAFVFSGYTFPLWALPWFDQIYAKIIPYTFFSEGLLQTYQQGVSLSSVTPLLLPLAAFMLVGIPASYVGIKKQLSSIATHV